MIQINAKLLRGDTGIYATGEHVECLIEFEHKVFESSADSASANQTQTLAWASAQLHCYRKTSSNVIKQAKSSDITELISKTTLDSVTQSAGEILLATKPKILFCDLKLQPKEKKIYFFSENIPRDGPPTYRGHNIKYFYRITIATQRVKSKVQILTIPLRILPIPPIVKPDEQAPIADEAISKLTPTNPFLEKKQVSELETSWHHIKNLTARREPKIYRISNNHGFVGQFRLFKSSYRLGEDIVGSLDFSNCEVQCVQFSVKLQTQEFCLPASDAKAKAADLTNNNTNQNVEAEGVDKLPNSISKTHNTDVTGKLTTHVITHQFCYAFTKTQILVPIPLHITPTFRTNLVEVKYRLHFEFVTSAKIDFVVKNPLSGEILSPDSIPVETMVWNLPLTIYPCNPLQIYVPPPTYNLLIK